MRSQPASQPARQPASQPASHYSDFHELDVVITGDVARYGCVYYSVAFSSFTADRLSNSNSNSNSNSEISLAKTRELGQYDVSDKITILFSPKRLPDDSNADINIDLDSHKENNRYFPDNNPKRVICICCIQRFVCCINLFLDELYQWLSSCIVLPLSLQLPLRLLLSKTPGQYNQPCLRQAYYLVISASLRERLCARKSRIPAIKRHSIYIICLLLSLKKHATGLFLSCSAILHHFLLVR